MDEFGTGDIYSTAPAAPPPATIEISQPTAQAQPTAPIAAGPVARPAARAAAGPQLVKKERRPVSDDDNQATAATVKMMCDYIADGVKDDGCKAWAVCAVKQYAVGSTDPRMLFWGVFWLLKHCVKYVRDEPALFRMGEGDARDFLIAPAVLVRMAEPKEDCDGFTMLACTLLQILGVKSYIVTVKADPDKPLRWSHVFAVADLPGGACALDATEHGIFPGWMVPRQHIFDYQFWDLTGRAVKHALPLSGKMSGYVRTRRGGFPVRRGLRGLGDDTCYDDNGDAVDCADVSSAIANLPVGPSAVISPYAPIAPGATIPTATVPISTTAPATNWTSVLSSLFGGAARVASVAEAPPGSVINPVTGVITTPGSLGSLGSYLPILLIGGLVLFGISAASKRSR